MWVLCVKCSGRPYALEQRKGEKECHRESVRSETAIKLTVTFNNMRKVFVGRLVLCTSSKLLALITRSRQNNKKQDIRLIQEGRQTKKECFL